MYDVLIGEVGGRKLLIGEEGGGRVYELVVGGGGGRGTLLIPVTFLFLWRSYSHIP